VNFFVRREHPTEGTYFHMKAPVRFGAAPGSLAAHAPTIGQDTEAVRRDGWMPAGRI